MSAWDAPPTAAEMKRSSAWDSPPTPEELAGGGGKRTVGGEMKRALFTGLGLGDEEAGKAVVAGAGQGAYGVGDEAEAGLEMMGSTLHPYASPQAAEADQAKIYTAARDRNRAESERLKEEHPGAYYPGMAASAILTGGWASPFKAGAKTLGARLLAAMKNGLVGGGVAGLGMSNADLTKGDVGQAAIDTGVGAGAGGLLAPAAEGVTSLGGRLVRGLVKPTDAAKALRAKGVDMTVGQMEPESVVAQLERAHQSSPGGNIIRNQRAAGMESWRNAVLPGTGSPAERVAAQYEAFGPAYDAVRSAPVRVDPEAAASGFKGVVDNPDALASEQTANKVGRFLQGQVRILRQTPDEAGSLLKVRSNVRDALRQAQKAQDFEAAGLLQDAEHMLTQELEGQLPEEASGALRSTDAAYRKHKVISDAVARSGDSGGFTPPQLGAAVKAATEKGQYARGGGGTLRELARLGRQTVATDSPETGARMGVLSSAIAKLPGSQFLSALGNTPAGKRIALGETGTQQIAAKVADWLREQGLTEATVRALTSQTAGRTATAGE